MALSFYLFVTFWLLLGRPPLGWEREKKTHQIPNLSPSQSTAQLIINHSLVPCHHHHCVPSPANGVLVLLSHHSLHAPLKVSWPGIQKRCPWSVMESGEVCGSAPPTFIIGKISCASIITFPHGVFPEFFPLLNESQSPHEESCF